MSLEKTGSNRLSTVYEQDPSTGNWRLKTPPQKNRSIDKTITNISNSIINTNVNPDADEKKEKRRLKLAFRQSRSQGSLPSTKRRKQKLSLQDTSAPAHLESGCDASRYPEAWEKWQKKARKKALEFFFEVDQTSPDAKEQLKELCTKAIADLHQEFVKKMHATEIAHLVDLIKPTFIAEIARLVINAMRGRINHAKYPIKYIEQREVPRTACSWLGRTEDFVSFGRATICLPTNRPNAKLVLASLINLLQNEMGVTSEKEPYEQAVLLSKEIVEYKIRKNWTKKITHLFKNFKKEHNVDFSYLPLYVATNRVAFDFGEYQEEFKTWIQQENKYVWESVLSEENAKEQALRLVTLFNRHLFNLFKLKDIPTLFALKAVTLGAFSKCKEVIAKELGSLFNPSEGYITLRLAPETDYKFQVDKKGKRFKVTQSKWIEIYITEEIKGVKFNSLKSKEGKKAPRQVARAKIYSTIQGTYEGTKFKTTYRIGCFNYAKNLDVETRGKIATSFHFFK